jgi:hypothetical protein
MNVPRPSNYTPFFSKANIFQTLWAIDKIKAKKKKQSWNCSPPGQQIQRKISHSPQNPSPLGIWQNIKSFPLSE